MKYYTGIHPFDRAVKYSLFLQHRGQRLRQINLFRL